MGVVDIGSNSVRLVVYEGAVRSPTPIFNEKVLCGLGRQVGSTGQLGEESVELRARGAGPVPGHRPHPRRQEHVGDRHRRLPRCLRRPGVHRPRRAGARRPHPGPVRPARGRARRQRHHDGLSLARRHCRRPRRRQPGDDRGRRRARCASPRRCRSAACACSMPPAAGSTRRIDIADDADRAACHGSTTGRDRAFYAVGGTWRAIARLHMERTGLSAARHARLHHADRGGDRLLRGDPQGQEALGHARHRGDLAAAPRGAALRRAGAGAAAEAAASRARSHFSVFGIREGLVYSLLSEAERRKDPLLSFCAEYARLRSRSAEHALRAVHLDRRPVRAARAPRRRTRSGACAMPPACSPTSAGARTPTTAASRA